MRIVLGVDEAQSYASAARLLARLRFKDAIVDAVHVMPISTFYPGDPMGIPVMTEEVMAKVREANEETGKSLVQAAADCGLDGDEVRKRLATDEDVALISARAQEASDKGISGVPTYVFAQKYAVSGAQPAEQLARAIRQVSAEINAQAAE